LTHRGKSWMMKHRKTPFCPAEATGTPPYTPKSASER
jgi:hypothetical protein